MLNRETGWADTLVVSPSSSPSSAPSATVAKVTRSMLERQLQPGRQTVVFQPVFDLWEFLEGGRRMVGLEALSRFPDGPGPAEWFLAAAGQGLALELELAAIGAAVAHLPRLPEHAYLSVNASPPTMTSPEVVDALGGVDLSRVIIEVSEPAVMERFEEIREALYGFRALGLRLAVDDVGTGSVSLRSLLRLRPDVVKLDVSLTGQIDRDGERRALAAALAAFAGDMDAMVVGEGIERASQLQTLVEIGVPYGQGYLLARPAPLNEA